MYDVVVVGGGNAALCAALSAQEHGAKVLVLERAPREFRGGNSAFTGAGFRFVYHGIDDIKSIVTDLTDEEMAISDYGQYTAEHYLDDLGRVTQYHIDPDLAEILVNRSTDTVRWLCRAAGVRFVPKYGVSAVKQNGRWKFAGGSVIWVVGGGRGLVDGEFKAAGKLGITVRYETQAVSLLHGPGGVNGLRVRAQGVEEEIRAGAVVLACGGFESNREWRARYLGPGWDLAKVRGTRYNTGDGIRMAIDIGAQPYGQWSGCHAVSWERYAPDFGTLEAPMNGHRDGFHLSVMINADGKRFLDEGADFRNYTYAKYGRMVLQQPGHFAWQVFDARMRELRGEDYKVKGATRVEANTLEELASRMADVDQQAFLNTIREYNAAIRREVPFDAAIKDGRCTVGLTINKSNWANPIEEPPFDAYAVGTGVTFTFGGLKITTQGQVVDIADQPISGLYAAGELVGGIFYFNYPGGSGLMNGAVFGRLAGEHAAHHAADRT